MYYIVSHHDDYFWLSVIYKKSRAKIILQYKIIKCFKCGSLIQWCIHTAFLINIRQYMNTSNINWHCYSASWEFDNSLITQPNSLLLSVTQLSQKIIQSTTAIIILNNIFSTLAVMYKTGVSQGTSLVLAFIHQHMTMKWHIHMV